MSRAESVGKRIGEHSRQALEGGQQVFIGDMHHRRGFQRRADALRRHGYGLRLREEDGALFLTLKGPGRAAGSLIERGETEIAIERATAEALRSREMVTAEFSDE